MRVIGHRGCPDHFPENTVAAVRGAAPHVDWVEVDVQRCASGEIVVFHDEALDRLTGASGRVRDTTLATLSSLTVGDSDERIPTLVNLLDELPAGTGLNVELKHAGMGREVVDLLGDQPNEAVVSSFQPAALSPVDGVPAALLFADEFDGNLGQAADLNCGFVHPHREIVDGEAVERAHEQGVEVNAWTVRTAGEARRLRAAGVDGLIVDSWTVVGG